MSLSAVEQKPRPRERTWDNQGGDLLRHVCVLVSVGGEGGGACVCVSVRCRHHYFQKLWGAGQHGQVESLTGVTHLSNDDAGVFSGTEQKQKISCGPKMTS